MGTENFGYLDSSYYTTQGEAVRAVLAVIKRAESPEDEAEMLEMLGLSRETAAKIMQDRKDAGTFGKQFDHSSVGQVSVYPLFAKKRNLL